MIQEFELYFVSSSMGKREVLDKLIDLKAFDAESILEITGDVDECRKYLCALDFLRKVPAFLGSFDKKTTFLSLCERLEKLDRLKKISVILDSGAFNAWTKGREIDLDKYIDFIFEVRERFDFGTFYVVDLDIIPGTYPEKVTTPEELDYVVERSCENYQKMKEKGISNLIAVHHYPETINHLERILSGKPSYLGLGGVATRRGKAKKEREWFGRVFHHLQENKFEGRVHGLAVTAPETVEDYPWNSVDSSSWARGTSQGSVYIFDKEKDPKLKSYNVSELKKENLERMNYVLQKARADGIELDEREINNYWIRILISFESWLAYSNYLKKKRYSETRGEHVDQPTIFGRYLYEMSKKKKSKKVERSKK